MLGNEKVTAGDAGAPGDPTVLQLPKPEEALRKIRSDMARILSTHRVPFNSDYVMCELST